MGPVEEGGGVLVQAVALGPGHLLVPVVPGEDLVRALARLHHLDVAADLFGEEVEGHDIVAHHGFAHRRDRTGQGTEHPFGRDPEAVVVGVEPRGHQVRPAELVALLVAGALEADAERGEASLALLGQQGDDEAGVEPAGEEHAHRDIGDETPANRQAECRFDRLPPIGSRRVRRRRCAPGRRGGPWVPVLPLPAPPVGLDHEQGGRRKLADAGEHRPGRRHDGVEGQVVVEPDGIDRGVDPACGHQRGDAGGEPQSAVDVGQVEGLDPEPVPGEDDPARVPFREAEGEHPGEAVDQALPPPVPALEEHLGVAG